MVDSANWGGRSGDHCGIVCCRLSDHVGRRRGLRLVGLRLVGLRLVGLRLVGLRLDGLRLLGYRCFMINFMIN
jgi:hypothetical protein